MLEAMIELGSFVRKEGNELDNFIKEIKTTSKDGSLYLIKFNFSTKEVCLTIDGSEQIDPHTVYKYLYVGTVTGPSSPQWYVTNVSPDFPLTETLPNLALRIKPHSPEIAQKLEWIIKNYFVDFQDKFASNKYRYFLDLKKLGITNRSLEEIYSEVKDKSKPGKEMIKELTKDLKKYFGDRLYLKQKQVALYTILIDGIPLSSLNEYREAVIESKRVKKDKKQDSIGICCNCMSKESVSADLNRMSIKYYTTNQVIFASNINKNNYYKNMQLCKGCYENLLAAEIHIQNRLKTKLSVFDCYVVPHFIYGEKLNFLDVNIVAEKALLTFNLARNIKNMEEFRNGINNLLSIDEKSGYFLLNLIFYKRVNQSTKILSFIKDVHPSIFDKIWSSFEEAEELKDRVLPGGYRYWKGLENFYYLTPIRISKGNAANYRDLLTIYDALFTGRKINKLHLINNFLEVFRIHFWNKQGYNITPDFNNLHFKIFDSLMLLVFLEKMGCLESEVKVMETSELTLKEPLCNFISEMNYNEKQAAMFLLGYLVAQVGNAQNKRNKNNEGTYKPILNKLNFNGMDKEKIIRLSNEILSKLRQEKILAYNEKPFYEFKRLLDKNINNWNMSKQENLYYLLTGYAFGTTLPFQKKEENENEQ